MFGDKPPPLPVSSKKQCDELKKIWSECEYTYTRILVYFRLGMENLSKWTERVGLMWNENHSKIQKEKTYIYRWVDDFPKIYGKVDWEK